MDRSQSLNPFSSRLTPHVFSPPDACHPTMIMSGSTTIEMSSWLIECPSCKGGRNERRGQNSDEHERAAEGASDPSGAGGETQADTGGKDAGAFGPAGSADDESGPGGGRSRSGSSKSRKAIESGQGPEAQSAGDGVVSNDV